MTKETLKTKICGISESNILASDLILATLRTDSEWLANVLGEMSNGVTQYTRLAGSELQDHITQTLQNYYEYDK